jgi:hypothetical protein
VKPDALIPNQHLPTTAAERAAVGVPARGRGQWRPLPDRPTRPSTSNPALAAAARERAAREPAGSLEQRAWGCLAVALATTGTVRNARRMLDLAPASIRDTTKTLLNQLTETITEEHHV